MVQARGRKEVSMDGISVQTHNHRRFAFLLGVGQFSSPRLAAFDLSGTLSQPLLVAESCERFAPLKAKPEKTQRLSQMQETYAAATQLVQGSFQYHDQARKQREQLLLVKEQANKQREQTLSVKEQAVRSRSRLVFWGLVGLFVLLAGTACSASLTGELSRNPNQAITTYKQALLVYSPYNSPTGWASIMNNLGNAYSLLPTGDRSHNLNRAISAFKQALQVLTRDKFPTDWTTTMNHLRVTYWSFANLWEQRKNHEQLGFPPSVGQLMPKFKQN